ncbi:unnamed protein product [Schistosoma rodhaini]|uniref:Protein kinase domain-containing protein n=1 Tax=Schistosoma rodhaini TaxID=6188 RepID=A0AA85GCL0_9TREM|nr:unnamed protein product [Schistosoma rodhaini]
MGWFHRHSKKKYNQYENFGIHTPKKSILRSSSRVNPNLNSLDDKTFDSDIATSVSLVNLRSSPSEIRRRFQPTNRSSHLNGSDQSDSENENHLGRGHRSVLFLDQVAAPDRYRTSRVLDFDSEPSNYSTFSRRSPSFPRTISPSSSSSLASYPANYEPSPLIRKKNFDDPGIELVSCSPLSCSSMNNRQNHHQHHNFKMHKFKPAIKRLSYLNAFGRKHKDPKRGNLTLILDQELDSIDDGNNNNNDDDDDDDNYNNNSNDEHREIHRQYNEHDVYEELPRLDTLKLSSNDSYSSDVHDIFTIQNYDDNCFYKNIRKNELNHSRNTLNERKGTIIKIDRHKSDVHQSEFMYRLNQLKVISKCNSNGIDFNKKNSTQYRSSNSERTPTGSTETLVDSSRKSSLDTSVIHINEQSKLLYTGYSKTVQSSNSYHSRVVDTNKTGWKTVSVDQPQKQIGNNDNSTNTKNNHTANPQSPRIIYVSKWNENNSKLSTNPNNIPISGLSNSSKLGAYSSQSNESDQTQMNKFKHPNHVVSPVHKTNLVTIQYSDNDD